MLATTIALVTIGAGATGAAAKTEPSAWEDKSPIAVTADERDPGGRGAVGPDFKGDGSDSESSTSDTGGTGPGGKGTRGDEPGGGLTVISASVSPGKTYMYGKRDATFRYAIDAAGARAVKVELVKRKNDRLIRTWHRRSVEPGVEDAVRWNGKRDGHGYPGKGEYVFRVFSEKDVRARMGEDADDRRVLFYKYKFPIRGKHTYGDGIGAPRGDHTHQGQDLAAACGTRLVAARGGRVQWKAYQAGGAGYYLVIDGKDTGKDYVYMHLDGPATVTQGERVPTGGRIGRVGTSGGSSGCHLHFEIWSGPGWYEGGAFTNPLDDLRKWDTWS